MLKVQTFRQVVVRLLFDRLTGCCDGYTLPLLMRLHSTRCRDNIGFLPGQVGVNCAWVLSQMRFAKGA